MKKIIFYLIVLLFCNLSSNNKIFAQLYQGPAQGSVAGGVMVSTDNFTDMFQGEPLPPYLVKGESNETAPELTPDYLNKIKSTGPEGTNFVFDKSTINGESDAPSLLVRNFAGVPRTNFIPPDANIAVGPSEVIAGVNSTFRIWDKQGNILKTITGATWVAGLGLGIGPNLSDPMITYDHFAKRWIMTWITGPIGTASYDVLSVSDDSTALGTWYNFAFRSDYNGNTPSNVWRDYEGVGFDANAVYITGNGFTFGGSFAYPKIRIINKSQLYSNTGGSVSYFDLWGINDPNNAGSAFGIRPCVTYGNPNEFYFLCNGPFNTNTYLNLYKLINPLTSPSMTAVSLPVVTYSAPPNSSQLNSTFPITAGNTSGFRSLPVYKNGFVYGVHPVRNGNYAAFKYYKINTSTNIVEQDITYGADEFYYSYPNLSVDKDENVLVTFSRSGLSEYIGAYYTSRVSTDPPNTFNTSSPLQTGKGTYNNTGTSNRWGDYMGAWLDPSTQDNFWIMSEYADFNNNWGVWVGNVKLTPYSTPRIFSSVDSLGYGNVEVNTVSDTQTVKILNFGSPTLTISNIQVSNNQFHILNPPSFPVNLSFGDSILINVFFKPVSAGSHNDSLIISSNDIANPNESISLKAKGYVITPVSANTIYGATGSQSGGKLLTINSSSGAGTSVGASGFTQLNGLSIRPSNNQLYASITGTPLSQLVRINSTGGDAYAVSPIPISNIRAIAFDLNDILYCATSDGKLYKYNVDTYDTNFIGATSINNLFGLSINPLNGLLFGISSGGMIYKINKQTAVTQSIGSTGITPNTDIAFSKTGMLYGLSGIGLTLNKLISIDTTTGAAALIGTNIGFAGINGIAISPEVIGIHNISTGVPDKYELFQNYPNPFNPTTNIKFDIPNSGIVRLTVYDILGKEIATLVNEKLSAGSYSFKWDGASLSSGVYFYKLETDNFSVTKRMVLLK